MSRFSLLLFFFSLLGKRGRAFLLSFFFVRLSFSPPKSSLLFSLSLFFFANKALCLLSFLSLSLLVSLSLFTFFLFARTHTTLITLDLKYWYVLCTLKCANTYSICVRGILRFIFSSEREKLVKAGESRSSLSLLRRRAMMMMMLFTREFLVNRVF